MSDRRERLKGGTSLGGGIVKLPLIIIGFVYRRPVTTTFIAGPIVALAKYIYEDTPEGAWDNILHVVGTLLHVD
jgi:hypothetical protein